MTEQTQQQTRQEQPQQPWGQPGVPTGPAYRRLVRTDGPVAGVCGGLGDYLGVDPTVVRVLAVLGMVLTFPLGPLVYLVLWAVVPRG